MSQDLVPVAQHQPAPFGAGRGMATGAINQGSVTIEVERAIAEAQGKLTIAKRFPRDLTTAHAELMRACKSSAFAAVAFYSKPQGGSTVTGPSIRLAEQIAQVYGNFEYGHRELSRDDTKSEVEVFAFDMEKNNHTRRQKTVMHVRDTRDGPKKLRDQTDVDQKINNVASKEMRGLILAMMPKWLVEEAVLECRKTIAGTNEEPLESRVLKMTQAFAKYGVKPAHLEKYLGHPLDQVMLDELVDLTGIFNSLKDGTPASEIFGEQEADQSDASATAKGVAETAKAGAAAKAAAAPAAAKAPAAEKPKAASAAKKTTPEREVTAEQKDEPPLQPESTNPKESAGEPEQSTPATEDSNRPGEGAPEGEEEALF